MSIDKIIASLPTKSVRALDTMRKNAQQILETGTPAQRADAERLIAAIDDLEQPQDKTPFDQLSDEEIARRVELAFVRHPMTDTDAKVIQALLDHPHSSSIHLSEVCGWEGKAWHAHFGAMCHRRLPYLWPIKVVEEWGAPFYSGLFATFDREGSRFTMRPAVAAALAKIGMEPGRKPPT
jgi:hypothetical protein